MYKLKLDNIILSVLLIILAIIIGIGTGFLQLFILPLPIWLLLASLVIFIIGSIILYPNGQIKDLLQLSFLKLFAYFFTMGIIIATLILLGKTEFKSNLVIDLSLFSILIPLFLSMGSIKTCFKLEKVETITNYSSITENNTDSIDTNVDKEDLIQDSSETSIEQVDIIQPYQAKESYIQNEEPKETPDKEIIKTQEIPTTILEPSIETEKEKSEIEEEITQEAFIEEITAVSFEKNETIIEKEETITIQEKEPIKPIEVLDKTTPKEEEPLESLGDLPDLSGELESLNILEEKESLLEEESSIVTPQSLLNTEQTQPLEQTSTETKTSDEIPQDKSDNSKINPDYVKPNIPQLVETPKSKDKASGGKITSIGKLLVDQRDIENIIETNALMQHISSDGTSTQIISSALGTKTNDKVKKIEELGNIKSIIIVNDSGFVQKSTLSDIHKEQLLGAMTSGTFGILSNLIKKLGFPLPKDISFETDTGWSILLKHSSDIYSVFIESGKPLYKTTSLNDKINTYNPQNNNEFIAKLSTTVGIIGTVVSSESGDLIVSKLVDDSKDPQEIAAMLPSFYSNTNILAKNMEQGPLKNIIINTGNNILLVSSIKSNIILLYATINTAIFPEEYKNKLESIINNG